MCGVTTLKALERARRWRASAASCRSVGGVEFSYIIGNRRNGFLSSYFLICLQSTDSMFQQQEHKPKEEEEEVDSQLI